MVNKRVFKKSIRNSCGDAAAEILFADFANEVESSKIAQIVVSLAELQQETIENVSVSFDKVPRDFENGREYRKARRTYFKAMFAALIKQFATRLGEIAKEMNAIKAGK